MHSQMQVLLQHELMDRVNAAASCITVKGCYIQTDIDMLRVRTTASHPA